MTREFCLLFSGQSIQESGMCLELWRRRSAREILERLKPSLGLDLEEITTRMPEADLALTLNAQRAIHAHHLGHYFAYKAGHPELRLNGVIGHSMGIVAALVAAEALGVEDSGAFMRARAEAFSEACRGFDSPMGLAALMTDFLEDFAGAINAFPGVSLALHNSIGRGVAGGRLLDLEALARKAQDEDWPLRMKILKVEGPYHTKAFSPCKGRLREALAGLRVSTPKIPVFMGTSGRLESDPKRIRELLIEQADSCELHLAAVRAAYEHGCRDFLEISYKPQPVTWIADQLVDEQGRLLEGVSATAVRTEDIPA